jgi:hypothetical protein
LKIEQENWEPGPYYLFEVYRKNKKWVLKERFLKIWEGGFMIDLKKGSGYT